MDMSQKLPDNPGQMIKLDATKSPGAATPNAHNQEHKAGLNIDGIDANPPPSANEPESQHKASIACEGGVQVGGPPPHMELGVCEQFLKQLVNTRVVKKTDPLFCTWQAYLKARGRIPLGVRDLTHLESNPAISSVLASQVDPRYYGSCMSFSLGLCSTTFTSSDTCPLGGLCPWRHKRLSRAEEWWVTQIGGRLSLDVLVECQKLGEGSPMVVEETRWDY